MSLAKSAASVTSLLMAGLFFVAPAAQATTQYWSNNGTTLGGNGTWDTANGRWSESNAAPFSGVWANGSNDTARFASTVGTVTLGENITVGGLRFDTTGYTIANSPFTLAFGATDNPITLNGIAAATITGAVGGTGNVTLTALSPTTAGTLTLNGTSTGGWSGTTTNNNGMTLALSGLNQGLLNTTGITLNGGGITLTSADSDAEMVLNRVNNSAGITANGGTITYTTTTAASTRNFAETIGSVDLISGQLNIVETLNKTLGSQTLTLSGLTRTGAGNSSAITFSSTALGASARNSIIITGHANSAVGEIIGPWATYGSTAAAQTDYATYNRTGGGAVNAFGIQNANIAASTEDTWGTSGANVTLSGATTLTATRTVNSLRYTGGALALVLGASNFNLETYGVLNGGSGTLTISTTGTGALTTPTGGGNLYLTSGSSGIAVSAPIKNNGADAVTLVAGGSGTLTLSSTASITGGITINAGTLQFTTVAQSFTGGVTINNGGILALNSTLGLNMLNNNAITVNGSATFNAMNTTSSTGGITLNPGSILTIANNTYSYTTSGAVTGAGGIVIGQAGGGGTSVAFNSTGNTFTGGIDYTTAASGGTLTVNSFADSASLGAGNIRFGMGVAAIAHTFTYGSGAIVPLTLTNRQFDIQGSTGNNFPTINNNSSQAFTINSALLANGTGTRTLTLGGTGAGLSTFGGVIANGSLTTLSITKAGTGTWVLSGNNTFTGGIANSGGTLILSGLNETVGQTVFSGTSTTIVNTVKNFGTASSLGKGTSGTTIVIGAFSTAASLIYNGSGDTTDRTFTLQSYTSAANSAAIYNNGTGALIFSAPAWNALGAGNGKTYPLTLGGTYTGGANEIRGVIQNPGVGDTLTITKVDASTWMLSGANTYSGVTTIQGGTLSVSALADAGSPSGLGSYASSGAAGLVFNTGAGTLKYTGNTVTINRGFTGTLTPTFDVATAGQTLTLGASSLAATTLTVNSTGGGGTLVLGTLTISATGATLAPNTGNLTVTTATGTGKNLTLSGSDVGTGTVGDITTGTGTLTKTGTGTWTINGGAGSYTGVTTVQAGTLVVGANAPSGAIGAFGNVSSDVVLGVAGGNSDASILIGGAFTVARIIRIPTTDSADTGTRVLTLGGNTAASSVFSGNIFLGSSSFAGRGVTLTAAAGGTVTFSGVIQDPTSMDATTYSVTKSGAGTVVLSNANTYTGQTTISNGTIKLSGGGSLASTNITIWPSGILDVTNKTSYAMTSANTYTFAITNSSVGQITAGTLDITDARVALSGAFTNGGTYIITTYTNLVGTAFAWTNSNCNIDYHYLGANQIAIIQPSPGTPRVVNAGANNQTATACTLQGMVTNGAFADAWICWGTNDAGAVATGNWPNVASMGSVMQGTPFSTVASPLSPNVTYWYRCYASNTYGTAWSDPSTSFSAAPAGGSSGVAPNTGGTVTNYTLNGTNYTAHIFTNSGTLNVQSPGTVEVLVVGGGGGGGSRHGGGGGAGGLIYTNGYAVFAGSNYTVTVGVGGAGNPNGGAVGAGSPGTNSVFGNGLGALIAYGGGFGGARAGGPGGSGGGGGYDGTAGGASTNGQGWKGGTGRGTYTGRGGGGAGGQGVDADLNNNGSNGGPGTNIAIIGTATWYAGGGGGGATAGTKGTGGSGIGGDGGQPGSIVGGTGAVNTGSGGGGGGGEAAGSSGGNGGSGIVIVRYVSGGSGAIQNLAPTAITNTAAVLNASFSAATTNYDVYVHWGITDGTTNAGAWTGSALAGSFTNVAAANISYTNTSLSAGTTYYYAFRATNASTNIWATPSWQFTTRGLRVSGSVFRFY